MAAAAGRLEKHSTRDARNRAFTNGNLTQQCHRQCGACLRVPTPLRFCGWESQQLLYLLDKGRHGVGKGMEMRMHGCQRPCFGAAAAASRAARSWAKAAFGPHLLPAG